MLSLTQKRSGGIICILLILFYYEIVKIVEKVERKNIMEYFEKYNSNTYAGSANQLYFEMNENEIHTGRIFYKITVGGEYSYSVLFSNIIDSTFANGSSF